MAKRTRAPARRSRATNTARRSRATQTAHHPRKAAQSRPLSRKTAQSRPPAYRARKSAYTRRPVGIPISYTSELLADGRRRYEQTEESVVSIADDFGVNRNTLRALAVREGWVRYAPPPRDLSPAAKLLAQAENLKDVELPLQTQNEKAAAPVAVHMEERAEPVSPDRIGPGGSESALPPLGDTIERLHRAILEELAAVETMRAQLKREPQRPLDAERTARTISSLTETLQKLKRLQCAAPQTGSYDDDMPADIDKFRTELARRIDAFVASRADQGHGGGSNSPSLDAAVR